MLPSMKVQKGVSIVELLISITIGVMILAGVVQLFATTRTNSTLNQGQTVIQDNLRFLIRKLEADASQTGNVGCFSYTYRQEVGDILTIDNEGSASGASLRRYDVSKILNGSNDDGVKTTDTILFRYAASAGGIPVDNYNPMGANPDTITLDLSTAQAKNLFAEIEQYDVLLAANCSAAVYFMVSNSPTDTPGDTEVLEFKTGVTAPEGHINEGQGNRVHSTSTKAILEDENVGYGNEVGFEPWNGGTINATRPYIYSSAFSRSVIYRIDDSQAAIDAGEECTVDDPQNCALYRDDFELAEGVEDFQIEYGWHTTENEDGPVQFGHAGEVPADRWNNIDRIRITLTLNSIQPVSTQSGSDLVRRTFIRTIALRNQIGD